MNNFKNLVIIFLLVLLVMTNFAWFLHKNNEVLPENFDKITAINLIVVPKTTNKKELKDFYEVIKKKVGVITKDYKTSVQDDGSIKLVVYGVRDKSRLINVLKNNSRLKFKIESDDNEQKWIDTGLGNDDLKKVSLNYQNTDFSSIEIYKILYYIHTGKPIDLNIDEMPNITLDFNKKGSKKLAQITRENTGKSLAIFINDKLIITPTIIHEITQGRAQIGLPGTLKEHVDLVDSLNSSMYRTSMEFDLIEK